jgi:hypothetical protein
MKDKGKDQEKKPEKEKRVGFIGNILNQIRYMMARYSV